MTAQNPAIPGEILVMYGIGLGPTKTVVPTGAAPTGLVETATLPTVTVAGQQAQVIVSALAPNSVGLFQINFTLPVNIAEGTHPVFLEIGGKRSNSVTLPVGKPLPLVSRVVNGASFGSQGFAVPGSFLTVNGMNITPQENLAAFPATTVDGLTVTINNVAAPLFHVIPSANQITLLVPTELPETGNLNLQVRTTAGASPNFALTMLAADPAIFRVSVPSTPPKTYAAALLANTRWLPLPESSARLLQLPINCQADGISPLSFCAQPARRGDILQIFSTGLGKATPGGDPAGMPLITGSLAPADANPLYLTILKPVASVGDVAASVLFSGIAPGFAGLYQVNIQVPEGAPAGDEVPMKITMPNGRSDTLPIAVR
ncbi:MAG: hypothetical protein JJE04_15760 [Acidobacteriia bacterium]|nr:hypothetical protein [Terriglobia bacterium]